MTRAAPPTGATGRRAGFTFLEIIVVLALAGVLMGLAVGFLTGIGRATLAQQSAEIVAESARGCLNASAGGRRAVLEVRKVAAGDDERVEVRTAVQRSVLTANFEPSGDKAEPEWFVHANEPSSAKVEGAARIDPAGKDGACAVLGAGSKVEYGTRAAFAMTDGFEVRCWVRPDAARRMTVLVGEDPESPTTPIWRVDLTAATGRVGACDVELRLGTVPADAGDVGIAGNETFTTTGGAVAVGRWTDLVVVFDGRDVSLRVAGVERVKADPRARAPKPRRLHVPASGVVRVATRGFVGGLDTLTLSGIFRSDEDVRRLAYGVTLHRTATPLRVVFANGRLDPTVHSRDAEVRLKGPDDASGTGSWVLRFGLYGNLSAPAWRADEGPAP